MADSVELAHAEVPSEWGITLFSEMVRLNVGKIEVLAYVANMVHCIIDSQHVPTALRHRQDVELIIKPDGVLRSVPVSAVCNFPAELAAELFPLLRSSHDSLIRAASKAPLNPAARRAYSPGVTDFLSSTVGRQLQHPSYHARHDETVSPSQFNEGATRQVSLSIYERNPYARQRCIEHYGCRCSICGFDFGAVFGDLGRGFIHVHHLKPLAEIRAEYQVDPIADLRPVCPNCHAMIHRNAEMMTIEQLRERIQSHVTSAC